MICSKKFLPGKVVPMGDWRSHAAVTGTALFARVKFISGLFPENLQWEGITVSFCQDRQDLVNRHI